MIDPIPIVVSANPARTMSAGRRFPAFFPASNATANMLSDSGAIDSPACIALYSRVICKKSGSAIIAPPRVICCIICWLIPIRKCGNRNRSGSSRVGLPCALAFDEPPGQQRERDRAERHEQADRLAAFLPDEDAEHDAAHADDGQHGADRVDLARSGVFDVADELDAGQHHGDDHDFEARSRPATRDRS